MSSASLALCSSLWQPRREPVSTEGRAWAHSWGPGQNHSASNCSYAQTNLSFFLSLPENPILNYLLPEHQRKVVDRLSTSLPLTVTANIVSHEDYWKRCCIERWQVCDVSNYGDSWKRMFFERHLENILKFFIPSTTDPKKVLELIPLCKGYVQKLEVDQFLPPVWVDEKEESKDLADTEENANFNEAYTHHYDLKDLITALPHLEELHLTYGVKSCGMNFEWSLFNFTEQDCFSLAAAVKMCHNLKVIYPKLNLTPSARSSNCLCIEIQGPVLLAGNTLPFASYRVCQSAEMLTCWPGAEYLVLPCPC